jgi:hypothetical protein
MRPTTELAYWSRDFETAEAEKALTMNRARKLQPGWPRAASVDAGPRRGQGSRAEQALVQAEKKEAVEVEGETTMDLYMTVTWTDVIEASGSTPDPP